MRYWDTSALLPLFIAERESSAALRWLRDDPEVVVWTLARLEVLSALARRGRDEPAAARQLRLVRRSTAARRWLLSARAFTFSGRTSRSAWAAGAAGVGVR